MLLENGQIIRITSKAIISDRILKKHSNLPNDCRLDVFKNQDGSFTALLTEDDEAHPFELSVGNCLFSNTRSYQFFYLTDILKNPTARKSQALIKYIHAQKPDFFINKSSLPIDLDQEVGILCCDKEAEDFYIANGIDVLASLNTPCNLYGLSGRKVGCYLNKNELIYYSSDDCGLIVSTDKLSMYHINEINEVLEEHGRSLNVPRIERYLKRKIPSRNGENISEMTLPLNKGTSTSVHFARAVIDGEQVTVTIKASLLDNLTLNDRKYKLYHSGVGYLLTLCDNERDADGFSLNFQHLEFENLTYIHHKDFMAQDENTRLALLKILADHGVYADLPIVPQIPVCDLEDNRIKWVEIKDKHGKTHGVQLSGELLFERHLHGVNCALYGSHRHATLLICADQPIWSLKGDMREMMDMVNKYIAPNIGHFEKSDLQVAIAKALIEVGYVKCVEV